MKRQHKYTKQTNQTMQSKIVLTIYTRSYLFLALREIFRKGVTNHKARKKLANQKWIHRSVYPCGISEQAFGSRCADGLYRGFRDTSGCNAGYILRGYHKLSTSILSAYSLSQRKSKILCKLRKNKKEIEGKQWNKCSKVWWTMLTWKHCLYLAIIRLRLVPLSWSHAAIYFSRNLNLTFASRVTD